MQFTLSFTEQEFDQALRDVQALKVAHQPPAPPEDGGGTTTPPPPVPVETFFSDHFAEMPVGALPVDPATLTPDQLWVAANQDNATTSISANHTLINTVEQVSSKGQTGSRAFFSGVAWNRFSPLYRKLDLSKKTLPKVVEWGWRTLIPELIPIQQGESNFCTLGMEGKMGVLGIWACNMEVLNGMMLPWLQNSSNKQRVFTAAKRDPLPINQPYTTTLTGYFTDDLTIGYMILRYLDTTIRADKVAMCGPGGGLGAAMCLYMGSSGAVLPPKNNKKYGVEFDQVYVKVVGE